MKKIKLKILKKNRKYFACMSDNHKCKLLINENSSDLEPGEESREFLVNDISVRSKYGTDLIYELYAKETEETKGICTLKHEKFNSHLVDACRKLGGKWDKGESAWIFSAIIEDKIEELDILYNSEHIAVEITAKEKISWCNETVDFLGYTIARAYGRDTGAKLGDDVNQISGKIGSGGSMKNWTTYVTEGSTFRLMVPKDLLNSFEYEEEWECVFIEKERPFKEPQQ